MPDGTTLPELSSAVIAQIPASCICIWELPPGATHWRRTELRAGCPWHGGGEERL